MKLFACVAAAVMLMPLPGVARQKSPGAGPIIVLETAKGVIEIETYPDEAPKSVALIVGLVKKGFYNGLRFHRAEANFVIQVGDPQRHHEINEAFHGAIYSGAHNAYLAEVAIATRARVQPFRRAQFRNLGRLPKSYAEHDRVVVAILRGQRAAATEAMRAHILTVREEYEAYVQSL